jgi:hypothetical protein
VSGSAAYAVVQFGRVGIGELLVGVVRKERVMNSDGEVKASRKVKRWVSMRWSTK